jgi:EcsC protein family
VKQNNRMGQDCFFITILIRARQGYTRGYRSAKGRDMSAIEEPAPALVRLIATVAERFGLVVAEKATAALVPILGAVGGAAIKVAFMDRFQDMAEGHFTVRHLERKYDIELVREAYDKLPR